MMTFSAKAVLLLSFITATQVYAKQDVLLWRHMASDSEIKASLDAIKRFNESQNQWNIVADLIPAPSYTLSIQAAAQADLLPCIIEVDQPLVPNYAWNGYLKPLDGLLDHRLLASISQSGKGSYEGHIYSLGALDVSLAFFTRKSLIKKVGARYPTIDKPWNKNELMAFLYAVKETGDYLYAFDMQAQDTSEWITYAWAPLMLSWGADLIERNDYLTVDGVLNSPKAIQFGQWIQYLVNQQYMNPTPLDVNGFINGEIALQYGGSWDLSTYYTAFKEDLAVLPVPDFGHGSITSAGSWQWAITETCQHPQAAKALITFLMTPEEQSAMSTVLGIFPIASDAAELTESYAKNGKWRLLFDFSKRFAKLRPETPAYSEISSSYRNAMRDILNGMPPALALELAVENIKAAFERHQNYTVR